MSGNESIEHGTTPAEANLPYLMHGAVPGPDDQVARQLLLSQHDYLRSEISGVIHDTMRNPTLAAMSSGGVWAWLLTSATETSVQAAVSLIPLVFSLLLIWRDHVVHQNWAELASYCLDIERRLGVAGWEHYCFSHRITSSITEKNLRSRWARTFLWLVAVINVLGFVYIVLLFPGA